MESSLLGLEIRVGTIDDLPLVLGLSAVLLSHYLWSWIFVLVLLTICLRSRSLAGLIIVEVADALPTLLLALKTLVLELD